MVRTVADPKIGDELVSRIIAGEGGDTWGVECHALPPGWAAVLRSRCARMYCPGDEDLFWVYEKLPGRRVLVTDSDFGRLPVSDRMRPRYIRASQTALSLLSGSPDWASLAPEDLSEAKGMCNRCVRKDQCDWLTVYGMLGCPHVAALRRGASCLGDAAKILRAGETGGVRPQVQCLRELGLEGAFQDALSRLAEDTPRLSDATALSPVAAAGGAIDMLDREARSDALVVSWVSKAKLERANASHQQTLQLLVRFLERHGFMVERSRLVDAYCRLRTEPAIFEVKSITPSNERAQCRHALSQLYEYRYLHSVPDASLWLVLSDRPQLDWLVGYLQGDRGLQVIWVEDGALKGPSVERLLESGSAARRRGASAS